MPYFQRRKLLLANPATRKRPKAKAIHKKPAGNGKGIAAKKKSKAKSKAAAASADLADDDLPAAEDDLPDGEYMYEAGQLYPLDAPINHPDGELQYILGTEGHLLGFIRNSSDPESLKTVVRH